MPLTISQWVKMVHTNAVSKGFWNKIPEFGTLIALVHSELSEALEADRKGDVEDGEHEVAKELADVVIRILDLCGGLGIDLEVAMLKKHAWNTTRPPLHGKRY